MELAEHEDYICCENEERLWSSYVGVLQKTDPASTLWQFMVGGLETMGSSSDMRGLYLGGGKRFSAKGGSSGKRDFLGTLSSQPP